MNIKARSAPYQKDDSSVSAIRRWPSLWPWLALLLVMVFVIAFSSSSKGKCSRKQQVYRPSIKPTPGHQRAWRAFARSIWRFWRRICRFFVEELSVSLLMTVPLVAIIMVAFSRDSDNRSAIAIGGFTAIAGLLAVHENVRSRRGAVYPRVNVRWIDNAGGSRIVFRNDGVGTAYLRNLRVESRSVTEGKDRGFALQELVILKSGEEKHLRFGGGDRVQRAFAGFRELRVRANLADVHDRRLLAIDARYDDAEFPVGPDEQDLGIWYHDSRKGSFIP